MHQKRYGESAYRGSIHRKRLFIGNNPPPALFTVPEKNGTNH